QPYGPSEGLPDRVLPRFFRPRRPAGALSAELLPVHRAFGRSRYRLFAQGRRIEDRRWRRLARNPRQRDGPPTGIEELRHRPGRVSGLCLRDGDRADCDAEIRNPRSAHLLRVGSALAATLRVRAARHPVFGARAVVMKTTLAWLKTHLETDASPEAIAERLIMLGHDVEG